MSDPKELGDLIHRELVRLGIWREPAEGTAELEPERIGVGYGYPIIGLEKFLGYFDRSLNIANFPSISMLTDFSYAVSYCKYIKKPASDFISLDGVTDKRYQDRARKALSFFKSLYGITGSFLFYIRRTRKYDNAKGLGESAAVAAAVARSITSCALTAQSSSNEELVSRLARLVSGSGTRSVTGGISMWLSYPYINERSCHGIRLPVDQGKIHFGAFPMASGWLTEDAHRLAESSPFYGRWMAEKFDKILEEIQNGFSIENLLKRAQDEMYTLNSVILSTGNFIQIPESLSIIGDLREFTAKNSALYYTADTGPSIVLMSQDRSAIEEFIEGRKEKFLWGKSPERPPDLNRFASEADTFFMENS
ncbi:MAG: mevalonate pyrophosphate decarboxylase [Thermoplasmataceae archaeon]